MIDKKLSSEKERAALKVYDAQEITAIKKLDDDAISVGTTASHYSSPGSEPRELTPPTRMGSADVAVGTTSFTRLRAGRQGVDSCARSLLQSQIRPSDDDYPRGV